MRKIFCILDIETLTDARLAFDIAWMICDSKGNVLDTYNALVREILDMPFAYALLTRDSFIKNKSQYYLDAINDGSIPIKSLHDIADDFALIGRKYNARVVMCAYNGSFDFNVLNDNCVQLGWSNFFNPNIETIDIMTLALATICDSNKYVRWCLLHGAVTEKGNVKTNAQTVYAYMLDDINFVEQHHALADCEIEHDIFFRARSYHKGGHTHFCNPLFRCAEWKKVQKRHKK